MLWKSMPRCAGNPGRNHPEYAIRAFVDRLAVERAITNLVRNGVEAGACNIWVSVQIDFPRLTIQVADDGPGVPQELVQGLFKRGATSGKRGGSGIGLFNVMEITRAHGGTTSYQRKAGLSRFEMTLPNVVMDGSRPEIKAIESKASEPTPSRNGAEYVLVQLTDISRSNQIRQSLTAQGVCVESEVARDGTPVCAYIDLDGDVNPASLEAARIVYDESSRTPDKAASLIALVYKDSVTKG
ncbi:MAG: sensor histidine kinase [Deltaproteobacteria bacterium]|nr:sensor histidine kinase [Deltaproteobacteria bacterium]